jgi:hypothetical protein
MYDDILRAASRPSPGTLTAIANDGSETWAFLIYWFYRGQFKFKVFAQRQ